ncbi:MAG: hypothetical protein ACREXX_03190 [Gammaproteobacteria bacterium]
MSTAGRLIDRCPDFGKITSDGAGLITFAKAPDDVPVDPPATAGSG